MKFRFQNILPVVLPDEPFQFNSRKTNIAGM